MASDPEPAIPNRDPTPSYLLSKGTNPRGGSNVGVPLCAVPNSRGALQPWLPQKLYNSLFTAPVTHPRKHVILSNGGTTTSNVSSSQSPTSSPPPTSSHDYYNLSIAPITNSRRWFDVHKGWVHKIKASDCPVGTNNTTNSSNNRTTKTITMPAPNGRPNGCERVTVSSSQYCCSQSVPDLGDCSKDEGGSKSTFLNGDTNKGIISTGKTRFGSAKPRKYHYSGRRGNDIINNRVGDGSDTGETLSSFGSTFSPKLNLRNKFSRLSLKERSTVGVNNLGGKKNLSYVGLEPTTSSPTLEESGALATTAPPCSASQHQSFMPRINFRRKTTRRSSSADDVNAADPPTLAGAPFSVKSYALVGETLITPKTATPTPNANTALREFSHLDVNSILASLEYERPRSVGGTSPPHPYLGALGCRNVRTGASAALEESGSNPHGDGRGNELVQSCPYFRAELGGEAMRHPQLDGYTPSPLHPPTSPVTAPDSTLRDPQCAGLDVLDLSKRATLQLDQTTLAGCNESYVIENVDAGANFYRVYFFGQEHSNYFGIDPTFGPVAISLSRKCTPCTTTQPTAGDNNFAYYYYNLIIRTSQLISLKGSLCEEVIPSSSKHGNPVKGLPARDIVEYLVPNLNINCLRLADSTSPVIEKRLLSVDEQQVKKNYKVGILYCKAGQSTEEEMYNNEKAGSAFTEFLALLGDTITLKGFDKYKAELDTKSDTTGTKSVYTAFGGHQIMFHISTMLPFTPNNKQQISRKRHIGNDVVTIVFQEPGSLAFSPKNVRSHYQHVFLIVRPMGSVASRTTKYKVAVTRSKDVEPFGPPLPRDGIFESLQRLRDFILTKCINADNAAQKSEKFATMSVRARYENLKDLAINHVTQLPLEPAYSSGNLLSKISLGGSKKRERLALSQTPFKTPTGGTYWRVGFHDFGRATDINNNGCLAISAQILCLLELNFNHCPVNDNAKVIFQTPTRSVLGWKVAGNNLRIYYNEGAYIQLLGSEDCQPLGEIVDRLRQVTNGFEVIEYTFYKPNAGCQLGFCVEKDDVIDVEVGSLAWQAGLRPGARILEVCNKAVVLLQLAQIYELLKNSTFVSILALPGDPSGALIKSCDKQECPSHALHQTPTSKTSHNKHSDFLCNFNRKKSSPTPKRTSTYSAMTTSSCTLNGLNTSSHHSVSPLPPEYMKCPTPAQYTSQLSPVSQRIANTIFGSGPPASPQTRTLVQGPTTLAPLKINSDLSNISKVADLNYCKIINDAKLRSLTGESRCSTIASNSSPHKRSLPTASQNTSKPCVAHRNSCSAQSYYTYPNACLAGSSGLGPAHHARHNSLLATTNPCEQLCNYRGSCSTNTELERHLRRLIMFEDEEEEDVKLLVDDTHPKKLLSFEQANSNPSTNTPQCGPESEEWNFLVEATCKTLQMCQPEDFESSDTVSSWCSLNDNNDVESHNSLRKISGHPTQNSNQVITQLKARCQKLEAKCNEESRERKSLQERIKFLTGENEKLKQELSVWRTNWHSSPLPHSNAQHH